jgi:glycosyltransferase involved in cell wall biosynthesis
VVRTEFLERAFVEPSLSVRPHLSARTVLVHDYLNQYGGAERLLEVLHDLAPEAPVYTSIYDPDSMPAAYRGWEIHDTWIDKLPGVHRHHQRALPVFPLVFERMQLPECDLVLSSSSAFAKMVRPPSGAVHISYIHSPMRFAWNLDAYVARERLPDMARIALRPLMAMFRQRDRATASRVDRFVANSTVVRDRIRAFWRRDATVINPPVETAAFEPLPASEVQDYFLMVSRLVPYKRIDLAIEACNALRLPLWIVGDGRDRSVLEAIAGPTIRFLGWVSDEERRTLYARCRGSIFMSEDDFGIAQVESQAAGRPVIALAAGGAVDTVVNRETGIHVREQTTSSLIEALGRFDQTVFEPARLVAHARSFSRERFEGQIISLIEETMDCARSGERRRWN